MRVTDIRGFTLIELLVTVAVVGILAAIAVPGLLRARMASNEASAIASLRTINSSQQSYAFTCGQGRYAATLIVLGTPPGAGEPAFISPDLGSALSPNKSGYSMAMAGTAPGGPVLPSCNGGALVTGYVATADPVVVRATGFRFFWTNTAGAIFAQSTVFASTTEVGPPAADPGAASVE